MVDKIEKFLETEFTEDNRYITYEVRENGVDRLIYCKILNHDHWLIFWKNKSGWTYRKEYTSALLWNKSKVINKSKYDKYTQEVFN